jgi:hypothetical protein
MDDQAIQELANKIKEDKTELRKILHSNIDPFEKVKLLESLAKKIKNNIKILNTNYLPDAPDDERIKILKGYSDVLPDAPKNEELLKKLKEIQNNDARDILNDVAYLNLIDDFDFENSDEKDAVRQQDNDMQTDNKSIEVNDLPSSNSDKNQKKIELEAQLEALKEKEEEAEELARLQKEEEAKAIADAAQRKAEGAALQKRIDEAKEASRIKGEQIARQKKQQVADEEAGRIQAYKKEEEDKQQIREKFQDGRMRAATLKVIADAAQRKAEGEAALQKAEGEAALRKAEGEAAQRKAESEAALRKAEDTEKKAREISEDDFNKAIKIIRHLFDIKENESITFAKI